MNQRCLPPPPFKRSGAPRVQTLFTLEIVVSQPIRLVTGNLALLLITAIDGESYGSVCHSDTFSPRGRIKKQLSGYAHCRCSFYISKSV